MCVCVFNHTVPGPYDTKIRQLCLPLETLALEAKQTQIIFLPNDRGYKRHAHPIGRDWWTGSTQDPNRREDLCQDLPWRSLPTSMPLAKTPQLEVSKYSFILLSPRGWDSPENHDICDCHLIPTCWKDKLRRQMWGMEIVYWAPHWEMLQQKCYSCPSTWSHISSMSQFYNIISLISHPPVADLLFLWSLSQLATGNLVFVDTWGQGIPVSSHFPVGK